MGWPFVNTPGNPLLATGGSYNPDNQSWTATRTPGAPAARENHTAVAAGGEMIVWGCGTLNELESIVCDDGGRYSVLSDSWVPTRVGGTAPSLRRRHTAVWTGSEMVVWGGEDGVYFHAGRSRLRSRHCGLARVEHGGCPVAPEDAQGDLVG